MLSKFIYKTTNIFNVLSKFLYKRKILLLIISIFIISRIVLFAAGIRFSVGSDIAFSQFIGIDLLKNNLLESIYFLHSQPPLLNLFVGIVFKLFPENNIIVFHIVFLIFGLILVISIFLVMAKLGISQVLSAVLTTLFMLSPSCILYENLLYYTYPITALLCLSALIIQKFSCSNRNFYGLSLFLILSIIVLTRSAFHPFWYLLFIFILIFFIPHKWKQILLMSSIPFILIAFLFAKNFYYFGSFTSSTWFGMSFSKISTFMLSEDEKISLIKKGKLSELSLIGPFRGLWTYRDHTNVPEYKPLNVPVLDKQYYQLAIGMTNNLNHPLYFSLTKQFIKDSKYVLLNYPKVYLKGIILSFRLYFFPSSDWFSTKQNNRNKLLTYEKDYNILLYGQMFNRGLSINKRTISNREYSMNYLNMGFFLIIGFFVSLTYGIILIINALKNKKRNDSYILTILFIVLNILYVSTLFNLFKVGENQRFRFNIDPLLLILFGLFINNVFKIVNKKFKRKSNYSGQSLH